MQDLHKDKLKMIAEDDYSVQALTELFERRIELEKPEIESVNNDQVIGQKYRAYLQAKSILKEVLIDLMNYKVNKNSPDKFNKGR